VHGAYSIIKQDCHHEIDSKIIESKNISDNKPTKSE